MPDPLRPSVRGGVSRPRVPDLLRRRSARGGPSKPRQTDPLRRARAVPAEPFTITVDGEPMPALPGQTIAAALIAAGRRSWRVTRERGEPRGLFCGIGVCFDCLVTVNGVASVRACLAEARPGDVVTTESGTGHGERAV
jgi:2Fe-2S iron-sulfur cluster protein